MCGICGIISYKSNRPILDSTLVDMIAVMRHRGPDEDGLFNNGSIGLGSCRLSIIDLASGRQPIWNEEKTIGIVFNGEIYNYRELRSYLLKKGHQFVTNSDTEVIIHLYEEFGLDSINLLNGIFAFAIWDSVKDRVVLARDRMGIKPLYYTEINNRLVFGSELKVLLAYPEVDRQIDPIALNEYLSFEYVPTPRTILAGIYRLDSGQYLIYSKSGLQIKEYYRISLARSESQPPVDWRDYTVELDLRMKHAIQQELVSDVPVGVLLSGGVDSSLVAAYMTECYPGTIKSFSIGFEEPSFDESEYSRLVSRYLRTEHHELILSGKEALHLVPEVTEFLDEPFGDSSLFPTFLLSRFARQEVKVVLGGDGGDELFAGYPTLISHKLINIYEQLVPWFARAYIAPGILNLLPVSFNNISFDFKMRRFMSGRGFPLEARHQRWLGSFYDEDKPRLLCDWLLPVLRDTYHMAYQYARENDATEYLNRLLYNDIRLYLEGDILFKVDRASMANSLEVRVPFLNRNLVDYVATMPINLKLHGFQSKFILKKCAEKRLPRQVVYRRKKGFNMPVARWLTGELRDLLVDNLSRDIIKRQDLFNYPFIETLMDEHFSHRRDNRKLLWTLLIFQLWYRKYIGA